MRLAARTDANQADIVRFLRALGCSVQELHQVGSGCPDLLVGHGGRNYLVEVKDGSKPPSRRKLTRDQLVWHAQWRGHVTVVSSREEAAAMLRMVML